MRTTKFTFLMMLLVSTPDWAQSALGTWKMNSERSVFIGDPHPRAVTIRFEPHSKGEVFTWDKIGGNGSAQTWSIILYFDGKRREFQDKSCPGTAFQSSQRLDERTVEILLVCENGAKARFVRRLPGNPSDLILDITDEVKVGHIVERHLVLEKQPSNKR